MKVTKQSNRERIGTGKAWLIHLPSRDTYKLSTNYHAKDSLVAAASSRSSLMASLQGEVGCSALWGRSREEDCFMITAANPTAATQAKE
ncbi:hypothetical protein E2C01_018462 [Portunus trituberculatus]|uniref:Uncharacterized protein n=1 Tax=Portunus trituberculatus TaxID=210409 RepID=A0A5B7DWG7_PORTR|nr:hypothetical protein [Portunus trituberculatus]